MWFFGWMLWLVPLILFMMMMRRRRWERWHGEPRRRDREWEVQQSTIDALETRVLQLEDRLDFTERLLAGRTEAGRAYAVSDRLVALSAAKGPA